MTRPGIVSKSLPAPDRIHGRGRSASPPTTPAMNGYSTAYDLGDTPSRPGIQRQQAAAPASTERHTICGECLEIVFVDTDGNGGLVELDAGTYQRHLHQVLQRRSVT